MSAILPAILQFAVWEAVLFAASLRIARRFGWRQQRVTETCLATVAIELTLESTCAAIFSFAGMNSAVAYWSVAAGLLSWMSLAWLRKPRLSTRTHGAASRPGERARPSLEAWALIASLAAPLILLSFKPVDEIDSINYLHYLIEWLSNRATPYTFATNYVAFWELSFVPAWAITGFDFFIPLLALKAVVLMALALWLVGRELRVPRALLPWTVFGCIALQHYWAGPSGVGTLKNDVLHGAGFVLMTLSLVRARRRPLALTDTALLAFGIAFGSVKYGGIFVALVALALMPLVQAGRSASGDPKAPSARGARRRAVLCAIGCLAFFVFTSGHYYLHNFLEYGSPFYPFQINLGFVHLPGTADLSDTSILYTLHDPRLWHALFLPHGGLSPAGLLFPLVLAATIMVGAADSARAALAWLRRRVAPSPLDWTAAFLLCGWLLYFRSVYSASAHAGDLAFVLNGLNSIRYVDGVLGVSEIFLVARLRRHARLAATLVGLNLLSRLAMLYGLINLFSTLAVCGLVVLVFALVLALQRRAVAVTLVALVLLGPFVVERNRAAWTSQWDDLKPALQSVRGPELAALALDDGGYFAGHVVAAGNPVNTAVRSFEPHQIEALASEQRPRYLALLVAPNSQIFDAWEARYGASLRGWGYRPLLRGRHGALFERESSAGRAP